MTHPPLNGRCPRFPVKRLHLRSGVSGSGSWWLRCLHAWWSASCPSRCSSIPTPGEASRLALPKKKRPRQEIELSESELGRSKRPASYALWYRVILVFVPGTPVSATATFATLRAWALLREFAGERGAARKADFSVRRDLGHHDGDLIADVEHVLDAMRRESPDPRTARRYGPGRLDRGGSRRRRRTA